MSPKILEIKKHKIVYISDDPKFDHLFKRKAYEGLENSYRFKTNNPNYEKPKRE